MLTFVAQSKIASQSILIEKNGPAANISDKHYITEAVNKPFRPILP